MIRTIEQWTAILRDTKMKTLMFSAVLALFASPASADCRTHPCDPAAYGFEVMLGTIIQNAMQRPPSQIYMAPPVYEAAPPQQRPLSREEWRQSLINEGNRFCATYPTDTHCQHP